MTCTGMRRRGYYRTAECEIVDTSVRRGDIFYADLSPVVGSEQGGVRPVLIIQNDMGNRPHRDRSGDHVTAKQSEASHPY